MPEYLASGPQANPWLLSYILVLASASCYTSVHVESLVGYIAREKFPLLSPRRCDLR